MKKYFSLAVVVLTMNIAAFAQQNKIEGSWSHADGDLKTIVLIMDGYITTSHFKTNEFLWTKGGIATIDNQLIKIKTEFNSADSEKTGNALAIKYTLNGDELELIEDGKTSRYTRIANASGALDGIWKISGREQDGKLVTIHQTGARKTLKMLTGTRFQWFAINPETKQFSGTGGGTYTFADGKYTENIDFFSRDNSRVGASLSFDGKLEEGKWHHSGLSSKGDKIYEVWERVKY